MSSEVSYVFLDPFYGTLNVHKYLASLPFFENLFCPDFMCSLKKHE